MKTTLLITSLLFASSLFAAEVDSTGLEGDNLDLNAVMDLFKDSDSPEDFEKKLNTQSNHVNNLDLNGDGEVDYIRVIDSGDTTSHALTLQVAVNETESQDVAVIELEETADDVVQIQIVGDTELYGDNYILLPEAAGTSPVIVNVIMWRPVRFMWTPGYVLWVSPWKYRHHPTWFRPWKPLQWHAYHGHVAHHHAHCRRVYVRSFSHAYSHHYHRTHSATFHANHHQKQVQKSAGTNGKNASTPVNSNTKKPAASPVQKSSKQQNTRKRPGRINTQKSSGGSSKSKGKK